MSQSETSLPVRQSGPWTIQIGPGTFRTAGSIISIPKPVTVEILPPEIRRKTDERHDVLAPYDEKAGVWHRGIQLRELTRDGCAFTGMHFSDRVTVKSGPGTAAAYVAGKDYVVDPQWATLGRIPGSTVPENSPVWVDYEYCLSRLDALAADRGGRVRYIAGSPAIGDIRPPALAGGECLLATVWIPGRMDRLSDENLFVVRPDLPPLPGPQYGTARTHLPKTLAKLEAGETVTIVAWGDSVTFPCNYQAKFAGELRRRFPRAIINLRTAGWPGQSSAGYMNEPPGGKYDFVRDVLDWKPDLVTIEFVNDAYLNEAEAQKHYAMILDRLTQNGSEVLLISPHFVRPDWMGTTTLKIDDDPRPYVKGLRQFALANRVALADTAKYWTRLWREGIPYITLEVNGINHPDDRGHDIFAQALLELFPKQ